MTSSSSASSTDSASASSSVSSSASAASISDNEDDQQPPYENLVSEYDFFNDDPSKEMREEESDDYELDNNDPPAKPFQAPQVPAWLSNKTPRPGSLLPLPRGPVSAGPLGHAPFPPLSAASMEEAYQQWAFWQWALFGGPHGAASAEHTGSEQQTFPVPMPSATQLSSHEMSRPSFEYRDRTAHYAPSQARGSSSAPGSVVDPTEDTFTSRQGANFPTRYGSQGNQTHSAQPNSRNSGGGYCQRPPVDSARVTQDRPPYDRRPEVTNYKPRFYQNQSQQSSRGNYNHGGGHNPDRSADRTQESQRACTYVRQWISSDAAGAKSAAATSKKTDYSMERDEDALARDDDKVTLADDGGSQWYEFDFGSGECRLDPRPSRGSRGAGGGRTAPGSSDTRRGGFGQRGGTRGGYQQQRPTSTSYSG